MAFGPEEIEEECGAEDGGDEDADKDVWARLVEVSRVGRAEGELYDAMPM